MTYFVIQMNRALLQSPIRRLRSLAASIRSQSGSSTELEGPPEANIRVRGRYKWWERPVYVGPFMNPLQKGPDYSFQDGRKPHITSHVELERRKKQVELGKKIVRCLAEIKEAEQLHKQQKEDERLTLAETNRWIPRPKASEEVF